MSGPGGPRSDELTPASPQLPSPPSLLSAARATGGRCVRSGGWNNIPTAAPERTHTSAPEAAQAEDGGEGSARRSARDSLERGSPGPLIAGGAPLQWRVFSCSFGPRASRSLMIMSERDARGPEDHDAPLEWRAPSNERPRPDRGRRAGGHDACPHALLVRRTLPLGRAQSDDHAASQDGHHQRSLDGAVPPPGRRRQAPGRRRAGREQLRHLLDHRAGARAGRPRAAPLPLSQRGRETRRDPRPQRRHAATRARHARQPGA